MNTIKALAVSLCCTAWCSSLALADGKNDLGIYFCTKNLAASKKSESISHSDRPFFEENGYVFTPLNKLNSGWFVHTPARHCFILLANEREDDLQATSNKQRFFLEYRTSVGFGIDHNTNKATTYPEDIFANADKYKDNKASISCVKLFDAGDLVNNGFASNKEQATDIVWEKLTSVEKYMDKETKNGYNLGNHNCCTVAYSSVKEIVKDYSFIDLYNTIDPESFNFGGLGVCWKANIDINSVEGTAIGVLDSSSQYSLYLYKTYFDSSDKYKCIIHDDSLQS